MSEVDDEAEVLIKIKDTYLPVLKKVISYAENNKKAKRGVVNKLKIMCGIFTSAPPHKQVKTFQANKEKIENLYHKSQKNLNFPNKSDGKLSPTLPETEEPAMKKLCTPGNKADIKSSDERKQPSTSSNESSYSSSTSSLTIEKADNLRVSHLAASDSSLPEVVQSEANYKSGFDCSLCSFKTKLEEEFIKHTEVSHLTNPSLWCKQCGKCFSCVIMLACHIKEQACIDEEMLYACGMKNCLFSTSKGQVFAHHLHHKHKSVPFLFCVHCRKVLTLPHCLVIHMQDECPFKHRNRKILSNVPSICDSLSKPMETAVLEKASVSASEHNVVVPNSADDYSESPQKQKKHKDGISNNFELEDVAVVEPATNRANDDQLLEIHANKSNLCNSEHSEEEENNIIDFDLSDNRVNSTSPINTEQNFEKFSCPCCDFLVESQLDLENHYLTDHKEARRNACLVCALKFESDRLFIDHFEDHRKGCLPNDKPYFIKNKVDIAETSNQIDHVESLDRGNIQNIECEKSQCFDELFISVADANFTPVVTEPCCVPYQEMSHDKNSASSCLKKFEELKSPSDLIVLKTEQKLRDFLKCGLYNCVFTTNNAKMFSEHLKGKHADHLYHCCYCMKEDRDPDSLTKHVVVKHGKRSYQCNQCFYRASTDVHVKIHAKFSHSGNTFAKILVCSSIKVVENLVDNSLKTVWQYVCANGQCNFSTYYPTTFEEHYGTTHKTEEVFCCNYCEADFQSFKRLLNHYKFHGLDLFQCHYCIQGTKTKDGILFHLCDMHADQPPKAYMRSFPDGFCSEIRHPNSTLQINSDVTNSSEVDENAVTYTKNDKIYTCCENELYHVIDSIGYPKHLQSMFFPRFLKNLLKDVICGVPFCNIKFSSIHLYVSHLKEEHKAVNFLCPYCPEMYNSWMDFKNHLLCHGSKLYVCGTEGCGFYDWNRKKVKDHKKCHNATDYSVLSLRSLSAVEDENKLRVLNLDADYFEVAKIFTCLFCNYKSHSQHIIKNHMYQEMAYFRFVCSLCKKRCISRKEIKNHFLDLHPCSDILSMENCNLELETRVKFLLAESYQVQDVTTAQSCRVCNRIFQNFWQLGRHLRICLQKKFRPYKCFVCKKSCASILALKFHTDKEHPDKSIEYSLISSDVIEEEIEKMMFEVRFDQLKDFFKRREINFCTESFNMKSYGCSSCTLKSSHKFNVFRHIAKSHAGNVRVVKYFQSSRQSCSNLNSESSDNSNESVTRNSIKRYSCGHCKECMLTIQDVESHMHEMHSFQFPNCVYYFIPNMITDFSEGDKNIYACAYCELNEASLFTLKKHIDVKHPEKKLKVKGFLSCSQDRNNYLACGYCYLIVANYLELQEHSASLHPLKPLKSIDNLRIKTYTSESEKFPNKQVKFDYSVYVCSHCGAALSGVQEMNKHFQDVHTDLKVEYTVKVDVSEVDRLKFYECEYCKFVSERQFLENHLARVHKMSVICFHCDEKFIFISKLKHHHLLCHKDLPLKYKKTACVQTPPPSSKRRRKGQSSLPKLVTIRTTKSKRRRKGDDPDLIVYGNNATLNHNSRVSPEDIMPQFISHDGERPVPVEDLGSLTVHMLTSDGKSIDLPLASVIEQYDIFPKVILVDILKTGSNL